MSDDVDSATDRVRAGMGTRDDLELLHNYLKQPDENLDRIYSAVTNYFNYSDKIDWSIAEDYVNYVADPMIAATTISSAAIAGCSSASFWKSVLAISMGVGWDIENDARVQALLVLSRMPGGDVQARNAIRRSLLSDSETVRDAAAIAAQRCYGRDELKIVDRGPPGRLIELVGPDVLNWIWPERAFR